MAITPPQRGFVLLIAVIFMSVMLSFGLALASLSYKQQVLASSAIESQYAFYAADAGLECALYADQVQNLFAYANHSAPGTLKCGTSSVVIDSSPSGTHCFNSGACANEWVSSTRLPLDNNTHCVDITVYKQNAAGVNYIFSQGYDVSCTVVANPAQGTRFVARGINMHY